MAEKPEDRQPLELPPSETWTPEQALAAAARMEFAEVIIMGFDRQGELIIRHSRMRPEHMLWMAEELRDCARGIAPLGGLMAPIDTEEKEPS